ncbi:MAG TPA: hypothetical protein VJN67_02935 [Stellaceae bacterium]|nr:hypothetical protein [Stellaceae bacterium]
MPLPEPKPGLVIRYDYLWTREALAGREQGKERPACLVAAMDSPAPPRFVVILPITHSRPDQNTVGVEIPARVRKALGLDDAPSWVVVSEHNIDEWPNAGLAPLPGRPSIFSYGFIPPGLFAQVKAKFLELCDEGRTEGVQR